MKLQSFDIPEIYANSTTGQNFIQALSDCDNIDIFASETVQRLVNHHWEKTKNFVLYGTFVPLCVQIFVFMYWNSFIIEHRMLNDQTKLEN